MSRVWPLPSSAVRRASRAPARCRRRGGRGPGLPRSSAREPRTAGALLLRGPRGRSARDRRIPRLRAQRVAARLFGADRGARGEVRLHGRRSALAAAPRSPRASLSCRRIAAPGAAAGVCARQNLTLAHLGRFARWGSSCAPRRAQAAAGGHSAPRYQGARRCDTVSELSGGNAQKVSIARWLCGPTHLLLLDEPTAGIDIGAKADILGSGTRARRRGARIVWVSSS